MRIRPTLILYISLFAVSLSLKAQQSKTEEAATKEPVADSVAAIAEIQHYGLRAGIDLSKILRSVLDDNYQGFEVVGDFRIKKNYYLAAELGTETKTSVENTFDATIKGSYIRAGFNYNAYTNWYGMSNLIYAGVRAGFSTFNTDLKNYSIYTTNTFFPPDIRENSVEFGGLNAAWLEVQLGVQAELFKNVFLGFNVQLKRLVAQKIPEGFGNLYVPGFNKVTTDSNFGAGYGYTLTYFIPIFKK